MPGRGSQQTVMDGLRSLFTDLAGLQLLPDSAAHMAFLTSLQKAIQGYVTQQAQAATGQGGPGIPPGWATGSGPAAGPARQGPPPGAGGPTPGNFTGPNPDELRRMLATAGASGTPGGAGA